MYRPPLGSGIIPHEAKKHHIEESEIILEKVLKYSKLKMEDIDVISYSAGPGLPPCLNVIVEFAIKLAEKYKKPLVPIHHGIGHIEIGKLTTSCEDPVIVYLSGGHNTIIALIDNIYRIFGETEDITCGNLLDVVAREMRLPMPGGVEIEKLAKNGKYIELPYVVKGMDLSFAGIQTAAISLFNKGVAKEDIAYSLQETTFAMLTEVVERALAHTGKDEVLLVGGVAANRRLQEMMEKMCDDRKAEFYVVMPEYSGDNGTMIAWAGLLAYKSKWKSDLKDRINSKWRIDQVNVTW